MRIQHNIPAMSSYRNYSNNVSAMSKNLEKLSSGYKINRAGDDAAGLAISEKMRAQISGLEQAQANAKDGISLVQTAEGALTEVHDMLNRMVTLAEKSANGTYDDDVDRNQLQKEMNQLREEIDRIADSSNFNGINLLDGSMEEGLVTTTTTKSDAEYEKVLFNALQVPAAGTTVGTNTILEKDSTGNGLPSFSIRLDGLSYGVSGAIDGKDVTAGGNSFSITIKDGTANGQTLTVDLGTGHKAGDKLTASDMASAFDGMEVTLDSVTYSVTVDGDKLLFTAQDIPSTKVDPHYDVEFKADNTAGTNNGLKASWAATFDAPADATGMTGTVAATLTVKIKGEEVKFSVSVGDSANTAATFTTADIKSALEKAEATLGDGSKVKLSNYLTVEIKGGTGGAITFTAKNFGDGLKAETDTTAPDEKKGVDDRGAVAQSFTVSGTGDGSSFATLGTAATTAGADNYKSGLWNWKMDGKDQLSLNVGTEDVVRVDDGAGNVLANTQFKMPNVSDGMKVLLGKTEYIFAIGKDSKFSGNTNVVDLTGVDPELLKAGKEADLQVVALTKLTEAAKANDVFSVGYDKTSGEITLKQLTTAKDSTDMTTMDKLEEYIGVYTVKPGTVTSETTGNNKNGKALTLQIGDTSDPFNQLKVSIKDCHVDALGIGDKDVSIATQKDAADAVDKIKDAINYVSDVRGTLGATQNRLDHTINNLSVMQENIQDAESTIRDVDVAKEMMDYTKNSILVQSAQAMLAQANQLPQGVLQLLG